MSAKSSRKGSSRLRRLLRDLILLLLGLSFILWGIPQMDAYWQKDGEHLADAAEATLAYYQIPAFGPDHVHLSLGLLALAQQEGISEYDLQAIIAAAASLTERGPYEVWLNNTYMLSSVLLGIAREESGYCSSLGEGVAIAVLQSHLVSSPASQSAFWQRNIEDLQEIAERLRVSVNTIPGSINEGAISCFRLMPSTWLDYGDGSYSNTFQAALNATRFLKAHGYDESPERAIRAFGGGQEYVDNVLATSLVWQTLITTALITEPYKPSWWSLPLVFTEFLAWYVGDYQVGAFVLGPAGECSNPYPGSHPGHYFWLEPVYNFAGVHVIDHPGQDYQKPGGGQVVACFNGVVTYAQFLSQHSQLAVRWWISGNVIVIRSDFEDGTPVCTFYGHGANGTIAVSPGDPVSAGQFLMRAGSTGFSSGVHLHFALKLGGSGNLCDGGTWIDPNQYVH